MELTVEIMSADPETGKVGLALCRPNVVAIGNAIIAVNGSTIVPQISMTPNSDFPQVVSIYLCFFLTFSI